MKHTFGPVPSRRLGFSLGIDVIPAKTCTLNCVYCQLGPTPELVLERKPYVSAETLITEVAQLLQKNPRIDFLTFSGSGEPTLNSDLGKMIRGLKKITSIPVAVITNSSLLYRKEVRRDLMEADVVLPSLDAVSEKAFRGINRPHPDLKPEVMIEGLREFSREYPGKIWLEVMLVKGVNDSKAELEKIREIVKSLRINRVRHSLSLAKADRVQLNTVVRPPAEDGFFPLTQPELEAAAEIIGSGCEIIAEFIGSAPAHFQVEEKLILATLKRRPLTLKDIVLVTGCNSNEIVKVLGGLTQKGVVRNQWIGGKEYYSVQGVARE
ncbi:MAG: radical SAM protein [Candidatus Ratteibacteria bacterium]|jgi:wyosine [tRNA(Phe)-imidazoG37] synthetase (radical SAM superfamily)